MLHTYRRTKTFNRLCKSLQFRRNRKLWCPRFSLLKSLHAMPKPKVSEASIIVGKEPKNAIKRDWKFFSVYDRELYSLRLETIFSRRFFSRRFFTRRLFPRRIFSRRFFSTLSTLCWQLMSTNLSNYVGFLPTTLEPFQLRWRKSYPKEQLLDL